MYGPIINSSSTPAIINLCKRNLYKEVRVFDLDEMQYDQYIEEPTGSTINSIISAINVGIYDINWII